MESNSNIGKIVLYVKIYKVAFLSENDDDKDELWTSQLKKNDRNTNLDFPVNLSQIGPFMKLTTTDNDIKI